LIQSRYFQDFSSQ